jgi:hypothetical protein
MALYFQDPWEDWEVALNALYVVLPSLMRRHMGGGVSRTSFFANL